MVGITVEEVIKHAYKKSKPPSTWEYDAYRNYKLKCLSDTMGIPITADMFIEGELIIYSYCGHDSTAYIAKVADRETLDASLEFYNSARFYYFEAFAIINGVIEED